MKPIQERSVDRRKHHVIYKTTCRVTGRYYIGMHSTDDLADGYIGSGIRLWKSIRKHGAEQHVCEVLEHHPSREALRLREKQLVDDKLLQDPMCMNLALGGSHGWEGHNKVRPLDEWRRIQKLGYQSGIAAMTDEQKSARAKKAIATVLANPTSLAKLKARLAIGQAIGCQAAQSDEAKAKRKETMREHGHAQGRKNSMYGRCWVTKDSKSISIKQEVLEAHLSNGWIRGRVIKDL